MGNSKSKTKKPSLDLAVGSSYTQTSKGPIPPANLSLSLTFTVVAHLSTSSTLVQDKKCDSHPSSIKPIVNPISPSDSICKNVPPIQDSSTVGDASQSIAPSPQRKPPDLSSNSTLSGQAFSKIGDNAIS